MATPDLRAKSVIEKERARTPHAGPSPNQVAERAGAFGITAFSVICLALLVWIYWAAFAGA